jgi:hypothetical protein
MAHKLILVQVELAILVPDDDEHRPHHAELAQEAVTEMLLPLRDSSDTPLLDYDIDECVRFYGTVDPDTYEEGEAFP